ncbi:MAG: hypothetical protein JO180_10360 [Gemmatirosa sp.]|nr:hypothetical protein [Gemmatirosa sp.]
MAGGLVSVSSVDALRRAGEALAEEVARALHRAHAGLAGAVDLAPIYARHADAVSPAALDVAVGALVDAEGASDAASETARDALGAARSLAEWAVEAQVGRALAPLDEREIAWERGAVVRVDDGSVMEYGAVPSAIANAADRKRRVMLDEARAALVARELAPLRRERLARERDVVESLGLGAYVSAFERLSGIDLAALGAACDALLRDTDAMWRDVLPAFARRRLALAPAELTRADALALFRAPEFDPYFPAGAMVAVVRTQVDAMGVDPSAGGRVRYDVGERPGKRARAFCAPVRIPDEVHLVLRPQGGAGDWRTLLHELGHALHFGYARADLPFEARWAGDSSVTEGYAMLFDHLTHDAGWLLRHSELGRPRVADFLRAAAFEELHFLRRYAAKLLYELSLYGGELSWDALGDLYAERLGDATGMRYRAADAFVDVDPRFYAARYLRAWQLQATLGDTLRERFDADWWRNPRAGPFVIGQLWGEGQREDADLLARRAAGAGLSFAPVVRAVERALA